MNANAKPGCRSQALSLHQVYESGFHRFRAPALAHVLAGALAVAALMLAGSAGAQPASSSQAAQRAASELSPATIRMLQHSLIQGGYDVDAADGVWGPRTAAAVREFQRAKGLAVTGRPDPATLAALGVTTNDAIPARARELGASAPPVRARTPADLDRATIRAIQQALDKQGLQVGAVDGVWGEQTTSAIANLQHAHGMPASGVPDAQTLALLGLLPGGSKIADAWRAGRTPGPADLDPAAIRLIQQALAQHGYRVGAVDGVWGERTVNALREFQRSQGIEALGEPDVYTLAALGLLPGSSAGQAAPRSRSR